MAAAEEAEEVVETKEPETVVVPDTAEGEQTDLEGVKEEAPPKAGAKAEAKSKAKTKAKRGSSSKAQAKRKAKTKAKSKAKSEGKRRLKPDAKEEATQGEATEEEEIPSTQPRQQDERLARDRVKSRKFFAMWDSLPEAMQDAFKEAGSRDEKTTIINEAIARTGDKLVVNSQFCQRLVKGKINSVDQQRRGAPLRQACLTTCLQTCHMPPCFSL